MASHNALHVMIAAGEISGDKLGADLMKSLRVLRPDIQISGLGGPDMEAQGLQSLFPIDVIAVMGIGEILSRLRPILRRIAEMVAYVVEQNPDMLVLIDSPEFMHRVAHKVKQKKPNLLIVDYVAPQVWGWRQGRVKKMRAYFDHVLAVLPFEASVFNSLEGLESTYVGHPAIMRMGKASQGKAFRKKYMIEKDQRLIAVVPGSRMSEVKRMMGPFAETVKRVSSEFKDLRFIIPVVPHLKDFIEEAVAGWNIPPLLIYDEEDKLGLFHASHAALITSGTVSLELGLVGLPMIVGYRMGRFIEFIALRILQVPSVVQPNLILDRPVVPEFLGSRCHPDLLTPALISLIENERQIRDFQVQGLDEMRQLMQLKNGTPSENAALKILELTEQA